VNKKTVVKCWAPAMLFGVWIRKPSIFHQLERIWKWTWPNRCTILCNWDKSENPGIFHQDCWSLGQVSNPELPEYKLQPSRCTNLGGTYRG